MKRGFIRDPSLVLYLPLWKLDGNSIRSEDAYGHSCVVTGAVWGIQGRSLDGISNKISVSVNSVFAPGANNFTVIFWLKRNGNDAAVDVIGIRPNAAGTSGWILTFQAGAGNLESYVSTIAGGWDLAMGVFLEPIADLTWTQIILERVGASLNLYQNTIANATTVNLGAGVIDNPAGLFIGACGDGTRATKCFIGEVEYYNRALSAPERQNLYLATRWRYR